MTTLTKAVRTAVLTAAIAAAPVLAQAPHQSHGAGAPMDQAATPKPGDTASTTAFKEADARMMAGMSVGYTGNPDVDFRTHMIPHHQGAIDMAKVALQHAKDPETKRMAQAIISDQEREIAEMQAWLKKNGS